MLTLIAAIGCGILGYSTGTTVITESSFDVASWLSTLATIGLCVAAFVFKNDFRSQHLHQIKLEAAKDTLAHQPTVLVMNLRISLMEVRSHFENIDIHIKDTKTHQDLFDSLVICSKKIDSEMNKLNHIAIQSIVVEHTQINNPIEINYSSSYNKVAASTVRLCAILNTLTLTKSLYTSIIQGNTTDTKKGELINEIRELDFSKIFEAIDEFQSSSTALVNLSIKTMKGLT